MSNLHEIKGDLFTATSALAHCVSVDLAMGKGVAVMFKQKFGGVSELHAQGRGVGQVATLQRGGRHVYYLITKEKYYNKPTYSSLRLALEAMADHMRANGVESVAMPRIGCGLDGLQWDKVRGRLQELVKEKGVNVVVYTL